MVFKKIICCAGVGLGETEPILVYSLVGFLKTKKMCFPSDLMVFKKHEIVECHPQWLMCQKRRHNTSHDR
jgi:hypothetical protein